MAAQANVADTIKQLNAARNLALADPALYPQVVPGLLRIVGAEAILELRRWGADFFAETFASPVLAQEHKQGLGLQVLDTLKAFLERPNEDTAVIKSVVQTAASIYPFVFRHTVSNPADASPWQKMTAIKTSILRRMDNAPPGVHICSVKFVQRVVQVQTPGTIADPRRPEQNEISLALVPRDHPIVSPSTLEAEASGLLDRLLGVLQDNSSDALLVTSTLNSLGSLVKNRPSIATKIITTVLNYNPFKLATSTPVSPTHRVMIRSMTRTTTAFLFNIIKKNPNHQLAGRIQQCIERLRHTLVEVFDESSRKRPALHEPTDGLSEAKRQRLNAQMPAPNQGSQIPPLPEGPVSLAQIFTLTQDQGLRSFDVNVIPSNVVLSIVAPLLKSIDKVKMDAAINAVQARYLSVAARPPTTALDAARMATGTAPDEDEDYEPGMESSDQIFNNLDQAPPDADRAPVSLGPFNLPPPPPLTSEQTAENSKGAVTRVFATLNALDQTAPSKTQKPGFNRLAASNHDRDAWITVITRLATRAPAGLDEGKLKSETGRSFSKGGFSLNDAVRDALYLYIIDDFRRRIDIGISWLNEEWYNDRIQKQQNEQAEYIPEHYEKWMLKILDGIVPFLDAKDKLLIRFLSEIPSINEDVLKRVVRLAKDPERVQLAVQALHYLILLRPPAREMALDALEELYKNCMFSQKTCFSRSWLTICVDDESRLLVAKIMPKFRPEAFHKLQEAVAT
jgi:symplekin